MRGTLCPVARICRNVCLSIPFPHVSKHHFRGLVISAHSVSALGKASQDPSLRAGNHLGRVARVMHRLIRLVAPAMVVIAINKSSLHFAPAL